MESATPRSALAAVHEQPYGSPIDEQRQNHGSRHQQRQPTRVRQLLVVGDRLVYDPVLGRGGRARGGRAGARGRGLTRGGARSGRGSRGGRSGSVPGCRTRGGCRGGARRGRAAGRGRGGTACGGACPEAVTVAEVGRYCGLVDRDRLRAIVAEGDLPLIPARRGGVARGVARGGTRSGTCGRASRGTCGGAGRRAISSGGRARRRTCGLVIIQRRQAQEDIVLTHVADLLRDLGGRVLDLFLAHVVLLDGLLPVVVTVVQILVDEDNLYLAAV